MSILNQIIETKKNEIKFSKRINSFSDLEKLEGFDRVTNSLSKSLLNNKYGIIGEHKRKSLDLDNCDYRFIFFGSIHDKKKLI